MAISEQLDKTLRTHTDTVDTPRKNEPWVHLWFEGVKSIVGGLWNTGTTFLPKRVEAPISPVSAYEGTDSPLIINTVGYTIPFPKSITGGSEICGHFHGQSA